MLVPATAKTWQTAFGKDFGSMAQGDNKTGQKGTNAMFVVSHDDEIKHMLSEGKKLTYGNLLSITIHIRVICIKSALQWGEI
jgi:hypothetical protein